MDYDLSRIDYTICSITYPDTLKILPASGQKIDQKFVVGDKNGVLQCLSIKEEEPVVQFKTLPGKPITSVQLACAIGTQADKIFTASGNEVKGYTRKGKVFLNIETSLTETITSMCIIGSDLILCSGRTVTYYRDLREYHSYICDDRVLDIAAFANSRVRLLVLIANKGAILLENGKLISRTVISSGPSRLAVPTSTHVTDIIAFYGAGDGSIGLITYEELTLSSKCLVDGRGLGSVVCLGWYFNNGNFHLSVGRHDGSIQLYLIDMENFGEKPRLKYTYFCGEPVTSVTGRCVGTEESELLVATFSGRVFALRSSHLVTGAKVPQDILAARREKLELEVARLEKQTANEREKYQRNTRSLNAGLSMPPLLDIHYELLGASSDGWQEVRITSAVPLDMLFIYCNKKLEMQTDTAAVLSICSSKDTGSDLLASVRCQAGTRRVWVKIRDISNSSIESNFEGKRVLIYVLPAGAPRVARLVTLKLPALPYYCAHVVTENNSENQESVGRHDGSIQLYLIDMENFGEKPRLKYTYFCGEPVTSVTGRCVGTEESELLVATFSGRVFALRSSHLVTGAKVPQDILAARREKLELEVARLEKQTANEREKYQRNTRSLNAGLSMPPLLDIHYELLGASSDGWQEVRITSAVPLDMLFIYCNKKLEMQTDTAAVLSICSSKDTGSDLLASVRCQAGTRRVWVKIRDISNSSIESNFEGKRVLIYVLPAGAPRVARLVTLKLPALPYYCAHVVTENNSENQERIWCQLEISGNFSVAEITSWLTEALPGELPRPASNVSFTRSHTLLETVLVCQYQRGLAIFKSDNVSTIATIRNIVSNCLVQKSIRVEISCEIPDNCCIKSFKNLENKFKQEYQKNKDIILKKAISMLDLDSSMNEEGPILCQEYTRVWDSRDSINETQFNELVETVVQWYLDWRALSLHENCSNETFNLQAALTECRLDDVLKILSSNSSTLKEY